MEAEHWQKHQLLGECKGRAKRKGVYGHSNCNCRAHHEEDSFSLSSTVSRSSLVTVNDRSQRCDITWNLTKRQWTLCHPGELICIAKRYTNYCSQRTMVAAPLSDQGNESAVDKRNNFGTPKAGMKVHWFNMFTSNMNFTCLNPTRLTIPFLLLSYMKWVSLSLLILKWTLKRPLFCRGRRVLFPWNYF